MTTEMVERRQRHRTHSEPFEDFPPPQVSAPAVAFARVDLLPPIVEIRRKNAAVIRRLMLGLVGLVVLVVAASLAVSMLAMTAENNQAAERARTAVLLNQQREYSELSTVRGQLGDYDTAAMLALFAEADWSRLMTELDKVLPDGVDLATESIAIKGLGTDSAAGVETTGLDKPGVIEISFTANADKFDSPTPLLNALSKLTGYIDASVSAVAASGEDGYTITGVVQLGADALGGTARVKALEADLIQKLHEQLETVATTPPGAATDAATGTDGAVDAAKDAADAGE